jgi:hypothetical protein
LFSSVLFSSIFVCLFIILLSPLTLPPLPRKDAFESRSLLFNDVLAGIRGLQVCLSFSVLVVPVDLALLVVLVLVLCVTLSCALLSCVVAVSCVVSQSLIQTDRQARDTLMNRQAQLLPSLHHLPPSVSRPSRAQTSGSTSYWVYASCCSQVGVGRGAFQFLYRCLHLPLY